MADPTPVFGITRYDEDTPIDAIDVLLNNHAEDLEAALIAIAAFNPTGHMKMWPTNAPPTGFLICDGSAVSRTTYAKLYAVIGDTYGAGDSSTTFNLPNLKGRVPVGRDTSQTEFNNLGKTFGSKTHQLTFDEMPKHNHRQIYSTVNLAPGGGVAVGGMTQAGGNQSGAAQQYTTMEGGDEAHNNVQPSLVVNFIIKT